MEAISVHKRFDLSLFFLFTSSPHFSSGIVERAKLAFLTWGDFHARLRFTRSTIPREKCGLLIAHLCVSNLLQKHPWYQYFTALRKNSLVKHYFSPEPPNRTPKLLHPKVLLSMKARLKLLVFNWLVTFKIPYRREVNRLFTVFVVTFHSFGYQRLFFAHSSVFQQK